jgi:hypothetical protein
LFKIFKMNCAKSKQIQTFIIFHKPDNVICDMKFVRCVQSS